MCEVKFESQMWCLSYAYDLATIVLRINCVGSLITSLPHGQTQKTKKKQCLAVLHLSKRKPRKIYLTFFFERCS